MIKGGGGEGGDVGVSEFEGLTHYTSISLWFLPHPKAWI